MNIPASKALAQIRIEDRYGESKQISNLSELDAEQEKGIQDLSEAEQPEIKNMKDFLLKDASK